MIGICSRYRRSDATHAALAIDRHMSASGRKTGFMCYDKRTGTVAPGYDNKIHQKRFKYWLNSNLSHIFWLVSADPFYVAAASSENIINIIYISWDQLEPGDEILLSMYNVVLVPSVVQATQLRDRFGIKRIAVLPFDCGYPICKKTTNIDQYRIRVFLPVYGSQLKNMELPAIILAANLVQARKNIYLTIYWSKGLSRSIVKHLYKLGKKLGDRLILKEVLNWNDYALEMNKSDLTLWLSKSDGYGLVGLTSLHMGTPVVAWDVTPINEYLSIGRNSVLVTTNIEYDYLGIPSVVPNYVELENVLTQIFDSPNTINELREHTHEKLYDFDNEFYKGLEHIIKDY